VLSTMSLKNYYVQLAPESNPCACDLKLVSMHRHCTNFIQAKHAGVIFQARCVGQAEQSDLEVCGFLSTSSRNWTAGSEA